MLPQLNPDRHLKALRDYLPGGDFDNSQDCLLFLALAYAAARRLEETYEEELPNNLKNIISNSVWRAYREALHVRVKLPLDELKKNNSPLWKFKLTRFGEIEKRDTYLD
jgi:hypothetical protein